MVLAVVAAGAVLARSRPIVEFENEKKSVVNNDNVLEVYNKVDNEGPYNNIYEVENKHYEEVNRDKDENKMELKEEVGRSLTALANQAEGDVGERLTYCAALSS